jgi:hypothetical protein
MFTWICPQCGREVPPAYNECPDCTKKAAEPQPDAESALDAVGPPTGTPPPPPRHPAAPPPQQAVHVRPYTPPPPAPRGGLPTWLLTVLFAFAFLGLGAGVYWLVGYLRNRPVTLVESPAAKPGAKPNPMQKYIEIAGVRFIEGPKKNLEVRFVVINHSPAEIRDLAGNVTVWGRTQKSEEEAAEHSRSRPIWGRGKPRISRLRLLPSTRSTNCPTGRT